MASALTWPWGSARTYKTTSHNISSKKPEIQNLQLNDAGTQATGLGILLGLVNNTSITYQFQRNGSVLPQGGLPQDRAFTSREYEAFVSDTCGAFRATLLSTMGLRYSNDRPPYEANGLQVSPTIGLNQFFAERNYLQSQGVPDNAMPDARLSYVLNGPVNGQRELVRERITTIFGPRLALALTAPAIPQGILEKSLRRERRLSRRRRHGFTDRFGSELITQFDQFGSFGLSTTLGNPISYNYTTSPRYTGVGTRSGARAGWRLPLYAAGYRSHRGRVSGDFPGLEISVFDRPQCVVLAFSARQAEPGGQLRRPAFAKAVAAGGCVHAARTFQGYRLRPDLDSEHDGVPPASMNARSSTPTQCTGQSVAGPKECFRRKHGPVAYEFLLPGKCIRELLLRDLRSQWRELSGYASSGGPHPPASSAARPVTAPALRVPAVTPSSGRRRAPCPLG